MLRGEILRDDLGDLPAAARAYREVYERFPTSRVRDDALQEEALVLERARDPRACEVWAQLAAEFPCTRRGREGRRRATACGRSPPHRADDACD
jgi:TolA-binding protein